MMEFFWRRLRGDRGFTLIELLIVVAIIAILAAILIPNFLRSRAQAQISASKGNLRNIGTALESYFVQVGNYPSGDETQAAPPYTAGLLTLATGEYLRTVPVDPCSNQKYKYTVVGGTPTTYTLSVAWSTTVGAACAAFLPGLSYTPGGGLVESP